VSLPEIPDYLKLGFAAGAMWVIVGQLRKQLNGVGRKTRILAAEQIIASKDRPDFEEIVRRLVIGG
jgi:hypothetical protein